MTTAEAELILVDLGLSPGDPRTSAAVAILQLEDHEYAGEVNRVLARRALAALLGWVQVIGPDALTRLEESGAREMYRRLPPHVRSVIALAGLKEHTS